MTDEQKIQLAARARLAKLGISPACDFGPAKYAKLEELVSELIKPREGEWVITDIRTEEVDDGTKQSQVS